MSETVIKVQNLSKQYRIGTKEGYKTFRETLVDAAKAPFQKISTLINPQSAIRNPQSETIWALKDVSFEVKQGEVIGIIGRNGAGKTTLLKILSKITEPTEGRVELKGRIGSLLEVGTGFHPELTGHENVYLYGAILGMDRWEVTRKFDEIVAFAGIEKFIETPVKRYSSGMYMRLAFAVAAHMEPEILLVDEVLAVGDMAFQRKCLGKMGEVSKEGRTVLFVSHNMAAVENLCQRGVMLNQGRIEYIGSQTEAINQYLSDSSIKVLSLRDRTDRQGSGEIKVVGIEIRDDEDNILETVRSGQSITLRFYYEIKSKVKLSRVLAGFALQTQFGVNVFLQHNRLTESDFGLLDRNGFFSCNINKLPLPASKYKINYSIMPNNGRDGTFFDRMQDAASLTVIDGDFFGSGEVPPISHGVCLVDASWDVKKY